MLQALAQEAADDDAGGTEDWNGASDGLSPDKDGAVRAYAMCWHPQAAKSRQRPCKTWVGSVRAKLGMLMSPQQVGRNIVGEASA